MSQNGGSGGESPLMKMGPAGARAIAEGRVKDSCDAVASESPWHMASAAEIAVFVTETSTVPSAGACHFHQIVLPAVTKLLTKGASPSCRVANSMAPLPDAGLPIRSMACSKLSLEGGGSEKAVWTKASKP